jgi:branched-chain amino acid transport system ATP-binding protein
MSLLEVKNINTYRGGAQVLFDVGLKVEPGEIVFLYGRNGAGKSPLLNNIIGTVPPLFGSIKFGGIELVEEERHPEKPTSIVSYAANLGIGWVPEDKRIFPNLTVHENLRVAEKPKPVVGGSWDLNTIYAQFPTLKRLSDQLGYNLSGGEKQLLAIARTLVGNPRLILLDEPSEGLSPAMVQLVTLTVEKLRDSGVALLIADQNLSFIKRWNSRVYFLHVGAVKFVGTVEELDEKIASGALSDWTSGED